MSQGGERKQFTSRDERWRVFVQKALSRFGGDRCEVTTTTAMSGVPRLCKDAQGEEDNVMQQRMDELSVPPMKRQEENPLKPPVEGAQKQGTTTNMNMPRLKVYSVEGPPPAYQATECTSRPEMDGATSDDVGHVLIKKHRNRRRKRKHCASEHSASEGKPTPKLKHDLCANGSSKSDDTRASSQDPKLTKNKRRKMKKRRHRDRLRASLACGEQKQDTEQGVLAPREGGGASAVEEPGDDLNESTLSTQHTRTSNMFLELLDFFQAIWEIYSRDGKHECSELEEQWTVLEPLMEALESGSLNPADLSLLARLKALATLRETHAKEATLELFQQETCLPDGQTHMIKTLIRYWFEEILALHVE
uniref:glutamate-rich protein 1-like n=1 Tax=Myxine glutinosa TaxID=7769 RepID=UPI00358EFF96